MDIIEILKDPEIREANLSVINDDTWNIIFKDDQFNTHEDMLHSSSVGVPEGAVDIIGETELVSTYSAKPDFVDPRSLNARIIALHSVETKEIEYISISKTADPDLEEQDVTLKLLEGKRSILFAGATGSGKTHLLNQFLHYYLPKEETYFLIEEFQEINIPSIKHKIHRTIPFAEPGKFIDYGAYFLNEANTSRVTGVVYGECKTSSVAEGLVQAANNGTQIYSTIHASSAAGAVKKLAGMINPAMTFDERLKLVAENIETVVYLKNHRVVEIAHPTGIVTNGNVQMRQLS